MFGGTWVPLTIWELYFFIFLGELLGSLRVPRKEFSQIRRYPFWVFKLKVAYCELKWSSLGGQNPPKGAPWWPKNPKKYPSTSSLWFQPIFEAIFSIFRFFLMASKMAFFRGFGPRHAAGLSERPFFIFDIIIYHPKEHSLWISAIHSLEHLLVAL